MDTTEWVLKEREDYENEIRQDERRNIVIMIEEHQRECAALGIKATLDWLVEELRGKEE